MSLHGVEHRLPNSELLRRNGEQRGELQRKWDVRVAHDVDLYERRVQFSGRRLSRLRRRHGVLRRLLWVRLRMLFQRVRAAQYVEQLRRVR
jgi:hypothetical protein